METLRDLAREWVCAHYEHGRQHLMRTEVWLQRLKPDASEEMLLAALTHDMERAFPGPDSPSLDPKDGVDNPTYNIAHSERSARIVSNYLREQGASQESIEEVGRLIRAHEYGGDDDENFVQAADSLSFLEVNVDVFLGWMDAGDEKWNAENGVQATLVSAKVYNAGAYNSPNPGNEYVLVKVHLHNTSSNEEPYNVNDFHLKSGTGNITDPDSQTFDTSLNGLNYGTLAANGGTADGDIVFQMKIGDHKAQLTWQPSFFQNAGDNGWILGL